MIDKQTEAILRVADIHVQVLQSILDDMLIYFPFTESFIVNMTTNDVRTLDSMTGRFGKLQDITGTKIIDLYLAKESQPTEGLSIIDKLHTLEKLNMLDTEDTWDELRKVRHHITHEYPDRPDLAALHLNNVYKLAPVLIGIYEKLAAAIRR